MFIRNMSEVLEYLKDHHLGNSSGPEGQAEATVHVAKTLQQLELPEMKWGLWRSTEIPVITKRFNLTICPR